MPPNSYCSHRTRVYKKPSLHPERMIDLYFVSKLMGQVRFAKTLFWANANVKNIYWRKIKYSEGILLTLAGYRWSLEKKLTNMKHNMSIIFWKFGVGGSLRMLYVVIRRTWGATSSFSEATSCEFLLNFNSNEFTRTWRRWYYFDEFWPHRYSETCDWEPSIFHLFLIGYYMFHALRGRSKI